MPTRRAPVALVCQQCGGEMVALRVDRRFCDDCQKGRKAAAGQRTPEERRRWARANPESVRRSDARRRAQPEHKARKRQEYERNRDAYIVRARDLKARNAGAEGSFTAAEFKALCEATGHRCGYCGARPDRLTVDHVIPVSRGGSNYITNIAPACMSCNAAKGAMTDAEFAAKRGGGTL